MRLDDMLRDTVAPVEVDARAIASEARRRGTVRRHQRRLAVVLAGVGSVAAIAVGTQALVASAPDGGPAPSQQAASGTGRATTSEEPSDPGTDASGARALDGRSTVALLRELVNDVADGSTGAYAGQGGGPDRGVALLRDTYGELRLTPAGEGLGVVGVNVQGADMLDDVGTGCESYMTDCAVTELDDGDLLRVYSDQPVGTPEGDGLRRVAEVLSERRGLRVVVSASNGLDLPSNRWDVRRPDPVLSDEQLRAVVTDDLWSFRVPAAYTEEGAELSPYDDLDADIESERDAGPPVSAVPDGGQPSAEASE